MSTYSRKLTLVPMVFVPLDQRSGNKRLERSNLMSKNIELPIELRMLSLNNKLLGIFLPANFIDLKPIKIDPATELLRVARFAKPAQ